MFPCLKVVFSHPGMCFRAGALSCSLSFRKRAPPTPPAIPGCGPQVMPLLLPAPWVPCCSHTLVLRQLMWPQSPLLPAFCLLYPGGLGAIDIASPRPMSPAPARPPCPRPAQLLLHCKPSPLQEAFTETQEGSVSPTSSDVGLGILTGQGPKARHTVVGQTGDA